jgi:hypothetical protein
VRIHPATVGVIAAIVVIGFGIGAWLALATRSGGERTTSVSSTTHSAVAVRTAPAQTIAPADHTSAPATPMPVNHTPAPATPVPPNPTSAVTPAPATPTPTPTPANAAPTASTAAPATMGGTLQGPWDVEEANVQVGTIVWRGEMTRGPGNAIVFDAHKQSVGGRPAVPCERATRLHVTLSEGVAKQSAPYREVNCAGVVSNGEMRVAAFSAGNGSFSGEFWEGNTKLGDFTAHPR